MIVNPARRRLEAGELSIGVGLRQARTVDAGKIMKTCGFDWLFIDLEHGSMDLDMAVQISVGALDAGIAPIVRVPSGELTMATRALDGGALGIVVPHVDTVEEARAVADALRYPPQGHRSVAGAMAQFDYRAVKMGEATAALNTANLIVVMIETPRAVANAEAIAAVPGIDALLIGTNDLCMEMGIPGDLGHERVATAYETVIAACRKHGKWPGMGGVYAEPLLQKYVSQGMRLILSGGDLGFLMAAASQRTAFLRAITP